MRKKLKMKLLNKILLYKENIYNRYMPISGNDKKLIRDTLQQLNKTEQLEALKIIIDTDG